MLLQLVLTNDLFMRFPQFSEGLLTKLRSRLVSTKALEEYAIFINLGNHILLGKGEEKSGGRSRTGILADVFFKGCLERNIMFSEQFWRAPFQTVV